MSHRTLTSLALAVLAGAGFIACSEDAPVTPGGTHQMTPDVTALVLDPFMFRATLDPYKIHQLPDFMIHSRARSDIIIQRSMFTGTGAWHTHPGLSYAYVLEGQARLQKFTRKDGCFLTAVYGPGDVYLKPPNEVHRAIVVSQEPEWELIVRLNFPVGGPIAIPADDPGC